VKKIVFILFFGVIISNLFCEVDLYSSADKETREIINKADKLVEEKKYETAFHYLSEKNSNEYIIAKKTDICLNYFVQSMMHQMFALKDLNRNEEIDQLRGSKGTYTLIKYDPVSIIQEYEARTKKSYPILNKALGDYYYEVNLRYNGRWIVSDSEIKELAVKNYDLAYTNNCFTSISLANYAELLLYQGNYQKSIELYEQALKQNNELINAHYNLAIAYLNTKNYKLAIEEAEIANRIYDKNIQYKMDALLLCSDISFLDNQPLKAIGYLEQGLKYTEQDYRFFKKLNKICLSIGDTQKANINADKLFALFPTNPAATQIVMDNYLSTDKSDELILFFNRNIEKFSNKNEILGNLYFHFAYFYNSIDKEAVLKYAKLSREEFQKAGKYTSEIQNAIEQLIGNENSPNN